MTKHEQIITNQLVKIFQLYQKNFTDIERKDLWERIMEGYCPYCGSSHLPCYCMRDD